MTTVDPTVTPQETTASSEAAPAAHFIARSLDNLWQVMLQPWLALLCCALLAFVILPALLLPQMSAQLGEDPAASARWLSLITSQYGILGKTVAGLGLFNAMNSLLWRLLTIFVAILLTLHLLRLWLFERQIAAAQKRLNDSEATESAPFPLPLYPTLQGERFAASNAPEMAYEQIQHQLRSGFDSLQTWQHEASAADESAPEATFRILAVRGRRALRLRMLLLAGGVLAMGALWLLNVYGWRVETDAMTPLAHFRDDWRSLAVEFRVEGEQPTLVVQQSAKKTVLTLPANTESLGAGTVRSIAGPPALLIQSLSEGAELKRPDGASTNSVGLLFPTPGSEETLILPQQSTVLRIVRRTDAAPLTFAIETIRAVDPSQPDKNESNRFSIEGDETRTLQLGDSEVRLRFLPIYARQVIVTSLPGLWLLWLALPLTLIGLAGLRPTPAFVLVQIAPWPVARSLVIVQGSEKSHANVASTSQSSELLENK